MTTGNDLLRLAATRIGQKYLNVLVPKDNPNWSGPWDCAEFASWVVFQTDLPPTIFLDPSVNEGIGLFFAL